jgi:hypothetical protein
MKYKQFNIGGLISYHQEGDGTFNNIADEAIAERNFRDELIDFLISDQVKLFKSMPEGNMLVRLTNVSLTPNK